MADDQEYSGKTLGEIDLYLPPDSLIDGLVVMKERTPVAGSALVPLTPKNGDRITVVFRTGAPI